MRIGSDQVVLGNGSVPAGAGHVYVDCSAAGLRMAPGRPVFAPGLAAWLDRSRLNAACGVRDHLTEPRMKSALSRLFAHTEQAIANLGTFLAQAQQASAASRDHRQIRTPDTAGRG